MKISYLVRCITILVFIIIAAPSVAGQEPNRRDSLDLAGMFSARTEQWKEAYNSKDASNLVPLYNPDAQYISSHVSGLVANGREKVIVLHMTVV